MADIRKRLSSNAPGDFFVDSTCINCDACRQLAPMVFDEANEYSFVKKQPENEHEARSAYEALLSCPTGSIGVTGVNRSKEFMSDFPLPIEENVFYCGFNSPDSFGGNSYFISHPDGNWLIDSPKYLRHLVNAIEQMGGVSYIFLTHRDDVADAEKYAAHFNSKRIIHSLERSAQPDAEVFLEGDQPHKIGKDFRAIPTFGHTEGHCVLLYRDYFLFTGDHLWWSRDRKTLSASASVCWYSWDDQIRSMQHLTEYSFEWVLPGHGQRIKQTEEENRRQLRLLVKHMRGDGKTIEW